MTLLLLLSHFSHIQLFVTPQTAAHQALPSLGFSRQESWSGLPFPSPMHAFMLSCFSRVRLCVTLWTAALQAPPSTGFSRQEYWSGLPFPSPRMALGQALFQQDCVLIEMKNQDKEKEARTQKRTTCDNRELEGSIQKPGNPGDGQEITRSLKRKGMIHLYPSEEVRPCQHLDFGFIAPRTVTQYIGLAKFPFRFFYNMDKQTFWPTQYFCCPKAPS